ncbi:unnamed protein product [Hyaloperonospora brassicae]|uniref:RxLR effector candidate protein n=1 Tax=Hyaloperonospora brassicae TaxID=162125 RepID=A0AAV0TSQ9_HYABA|nr:unnamed protein product [Hyaloperonospora brassicae]
MRLYPFVLLASTAVPTRVTDASGVSGYSHTSNNSTATHPPFTDDSNDGPANQQLVAHGITNDEERAPPVKPSHDGLRKLTSGIQKTTMFKLYGGISGPKLTSSGWDQVLSRDGNLLRMVGTRTGNGANLDVDMQEFVQFATSHLRNVLSTNANGFKKRFSSQDMSTEGLAAELKKRRFFKVFGFEKVRMLQEFLGSSEKATKKFFDTLSIGFGSELEFARFLSIEKQSLVNEHGAEKLQKELLTFWKKTKSEEEVLKLIDLVKQGWTYETLDTLVQFVALGGSPEPKEVYVRTIKLITTTIKNDDDIVQAIVNGEKKEAQSVTWHTGAAYQDAKIASEEVGHTDLADDLKTELLRQWEAEGKDLKVLCWKAFKSLKRELTQDSQFLSGLQA